MFYVRAMWEHLSFYVHSMKTFVHTYGMGDIDSCISLEISSYSCIEYSCKYSHRTVGAACCVRDSIIEV